MKKLRTLWTLILAILISSSISAQTSQDQQNIQGLGEMTQESTFLAKDTRYAGIKGTPFLLDSIHTIVIRANKDSTSTVGRYNVEDNTLLAKVNVGSFFIIDLARIKSFTIVYAGERMIFDKWRNDIYLLEIYNDSGNALYAEFEKYLVKANKSKYGSTGESVFDEYRLRTKYYQKQGEDLTKIGSSASEIAKAINYDKKELKKMLKENAVDVGNGLQLKTLLSAL